MNSTVFKKFIFLATAAAAIATVVPVPSANALTKEGHRPMKDGTLLQFGSAAWLAQTRADGLVALYNFSEASGQIIDRSGYVNSSGAAEPLNLTVEDPTSAPEVRRLGNGISIDFPVLIRSVNPGAKIVRECKASQQLTVEAWVKPRDNAQPDREVPLSIVTMSRKTGNAFDKLSSTNRNFLLGQMYEDSSSYKAIVRTANSGSGNDDGAFMQTEGNSLLKDTVQHVIFTRFRDKAAAGREVSRLYLSYVGDDGKIHDTLRDEEFSDNALRGSFDNWDAMAELGIGNEISYRDPAARPATAGSQFTSEDRAWLGEIYLVAVYCKALEPSDVLGNRAPGQVAYQPFSLNPNMIVTESHKKAALLYKRLTGVSTSLANPIIDRMATELAKGTNADALAAAHIATAERNFYNVTVRDFAGRMSTRDELVSTPLNDFSATVIGAVRDDINAKLLLTGNFVYQADPALAAVPSNKKDDLLFSNRHYELLESGGFDLSKVLKQTPQFLWNAKAGAVDPHPEPAGLLTTRAWMAAHAVAGTNRRPVEYAFRQFTCAPLEKWSDSYASDDYVGRDIDRFPAGDHKKFQTTCRACHSVMDGFRGAFAYYNFRDNYTKYSFYVNKVSPPEEEGPDNILVTGGTNVVDKMNHNDQKMGGYVMTNNQFINNATLGANAAYFGWGEKKSGYGVKDFGQVLADSQAFPRCMAQRVFRTVCKREVAEIDKGLIVKATDAFISANYNLRKLFEVVAIDPGCIGGN